MGRLEAGRVVILASVMLGLLAATALAQGDDATEKVENLNKRAMEDYDLLEFGESKKSLLEALDLIKKRKVDDSLAAKTHLNLGVVYIAGFKDRAKGQVQFVKALGLDPNAKLDPTVATPELQQIFDRARQAAGPPKRGGTTPEVERPNLRPALGDMGEARGLIHKVIEDARVGQSIPVRALLGSDIANGRVFLSYRSEGKEEFVTLQMTRKGGESLLATIPAAATHGRALQYYIEVEDSKGRLLASSGGPSSPNLISLASGRERGSDREEVPNEEESTEERTELVRSGRIFLALGVGTGIGWATGVSELELANITSGIAPAMLLHVTPEVGYLLSERFALSIQGRFQIITNVEGSSSSKGTPASGALAVLGRGRLFFGSDPLRSYVTLAIGGGAIRHTVDIGRGTAKGATDTVVAGPFFIGPGFGIQYDFSSRLGLLLELQVLIGYSDFTANLDGNLGFVVRL